jgi:hypothetical protein
MLLIALLPTHTSNINCHTYHLIQDERLRYRIDDSGYHLPTCRGGIHYWMQVSVPLVVRMKPLMEYSCDLLINVSWTGNNKQMDTDRM